MAKDGFAAAREFIYRDARLLERRLFQTLFEGGERSAVVAVLRGYQNGDGGFGHALEPDKRAPDSQPLDVAFVCETLDLVDAVDEQAITRACDFLYAISGDAGAVPVVLPTIAAYPRADHWGDGRFPPGLNPTARIAGYLHKHDVRHPWREAATSYCLGEIERTPLDDAHTIRDVLSLLDSLPNLDVANRLLPTVCAALRDARYFRADASDTAYGLTPLAFAADPDRRWRQLFTDNEIDTHLDRLEHDQQDDGGWPLSSQPPSDAARLEWRGFEAVQPLRVLVAYGRVRNTGPGDA
jgi:hypothetical protein